MTRRDCVDGNRTHSDSGGRLRGAVAALGCGSAWMACWCCNSTCIWHHHILHFQSIGRMLQVSCYWQKKLHLHAGCQNHLGYFYFNPYPLHNLIQASCFCDIQFVETVMYSGGKMYMVCGLVQYAIVTGSIIGFTLTASISME